MECLHTQTHNSSQCHGHVRHPRYFGRSTGPPPEERRLDTHTIHPTRWKTACLISFQPWLRSATRTIILSWWFTYQSQFAIHCMAPVQEFPAKTSPAVDISCALSWVSSSALCAFLGIPDHPLRGSPCPAAWGGDRTWPAGAGVGSARSIGTTNQLPGTMFDCCPCRPSTLV